jgi:DNA-binding CsgD family transcriptional regulator
MRGGLTSPQARGEFRAAAALMDEILLTPTEVAERLRIDEDTVRKYF